MFEVRRLCGNICKKIWHWSMVFIGPGSEKKWYPSENSPQGAWDHIAEEMLLKVDILFSEQRHHCPGEN